MPGSKIRPTQSLLIVLETASIDSTKRSTVSAIAYSMIDRYQYDGPPNTTEELTAVTRIKRNTVKVQLSCGCFLMGNEGASASVGERSSSLSSGIKFTVESPLE
jgi:hypothetical protein